MSEFESSGLIKCKRCNGRGEYRRRFYYENKAYYYWSKCGHCYAKGYIDWVSHAMGRPEGILGMFCDNHPAGSCIVAPEKFGGCQVYDGHNYISADTERGNALWQELVAEKE